MTDTKKEQRIAIEAELALGRTPKELAAKYSKPYITILGWKKKMEAETAGTKDMEIITSVDESTLHMVAESVKREAPSDVSKKIDKLVDGVTALAKLEPKFHAVTLKLLEKAESMADDKELTVKDWALLSSGIGSLYANIFNKAGVNVNVLNQTSVNGEKMSMFKSSMRTS